MKKWFCLFLLFGVICLRAGAADAVLIDHYDNILPPDGFYGLFYGNYYTADSFTGPGGGKAADADLTASVGVLRALDYFHLGKLPLAFQVILPFGQVEEKKIFHERSSGMGDLIFGPGVFFYSNPATNTYLSYWPFIYAPTGEFDKNKSINLGTNHWYFEHQLALHTEYKKLIWDQNLNYYHHMENTEQKLQAPDRFQLETNLGYQVTDKLIVGLNGGAFWDLADVKLAGTSLPDTKAERVQIGPSIGYQATEKLGVNFRWTRDVSSKNDSKGDDLWLRVSYAF